MARPYGASPPLYPYLPLLILSLTLSRSRSLTDPPEPENNPCSTIQRHDYLLPLPPPREFRPQQDIESAALCARVAAFCLIFINIKTPARTGTALQATERSWRSRGGEGVIYCTTEFKSARARADARIKPSRSIRLRRINRKSNNSPLVADVDAIMFACARACGRAFLTIYMDLH